MVAGVLADRGVAGGLEGGGEAELLVVLQERDEAAPHPAGRAGDDDLRHGARRLSD